MRQLSRLDRILQRRRQGRLANHRVERHRAVLACRNNILHNSVLVLGCKNKQYFPKRQTIMKQNVEEKKVRH
jgi:hypothetical protein